MKVKPTDVFLPQLDGLLVEYQELKAKAGYSDMSDLPTEDVVRFVARARAAVSRVAAPGSQYVLQAEEIVKEQRGWPCFAATHLVDVLRSLEADLKAGFLESASQLVRGELFGDFLEMAAHLMEEGYKDAAAVVAGSALEAHLRQLCQAPQIEAVTAEGKARKAEALNADLAKAEVYSKLDQKSVTAWLGLRNDAAHGHHDRYEAGQVSLLISGVRDFIARNP